MKVKLEKVFKITTVDDQEPSVQSQQAEQEQWK